MILSAAAAADSPIIGQKRQLVKRAGQRGRVLWALDHKSALRFSHENPDVQALYANYLEKPLSERAHHLLHADIDGWQMPQGS